MKKLLLTVGACLATSVAFGQGIIIFNNNAATIGGNGAPIYMDTIGGAKLSGADARAALLAGPAATAVPISLAPGSLNKGNLELGKYTVAPFQTWVTFRTGVNAGFVSVGTQSSRAFTSFGFNSQAVCQVAVWTGNYNTWDDAYAAAILPGSTVKVGVSNPLTVTTASNGADVNQPKLVGLQSFGVTLVPEPASASLVGLGLASLLIFRRRK